MTATELLALAALRGIKPAFVKTFSNGDVLVFVTIDNATTNVRVPRHMVAA